MTESLFGNRLRSLRLLKKLSQQELADQLNQLAVNQNPNATSNISKSMISRWENGKTDPQMFYVRLVTSFFGVSPIEFMNAPQNETDRMMSDSLDKKILTRVDEPKTHTYPYIPAAISAGSLETVDAITTENTITLPDSVVGRYAGDKGMRFMHINGESMNRVIPNGSLIGVKTIDDVSDLNDADIVVFCEETVDYSVKRFYNNSAARIYTFSPDSTSSAFRPMVYRYEDADGLQIIGRVVVYVVTL